MNRRTFLGVGGAVLGAALAGCTASSNVPTATRRIDRTFDLDGIEALRVSNAAGTVTVTGTDVDAVELNAVMRSGDGDAGIERLTLEADRTGDVLEIVGGFAGERRFSDSKRGRVEIDLRVPRGMVVESVEVEVGSIVLRGTVGDTIARVDVGRVDAAGVEGYLDATADAGDILVRDVAGVDRARADLGDVDVEVLGIRQDVEVATDVGVARASIARDLDLELEVDGLETAVEGLPLSGGRRGRERVTGRLNGGGHRLRVSSDSGQASVVGVDR